MNIYKISVAFSLLVISFSCDKYDLNRANPYDPKSIYYIQLTTTSASAIASNSATLGGNITSEGGAAIIAIGVCWSTTQNPTLNNYKTSEGTGINIYISYLTGLTANTTYYVRAYATNRGGTVYGNQVIFTTSYKSCTPELISPENKEILDNGCNNGISNQASWFFDWSDCPGATSYNLYVSYPGANPAINVTVTESEFSYPNGGYILDTYLLGWTWKVRAFINGVWDEWSNARVFDLEPVNTDCQTVTDIDGNVYNIVTIGIQRWMTENLKTTKYSDNTLVPNITDNAAWSAMTTSAYCWYSNDEATYKDTYGALYNWYSANTGKLCPTGWHVPTDEEWNILTTYLGGEINAYSKLRSVTGWFSTSLEATNETGFAALPGGFRTTDGTYGSVVYEGRWWSSSQDFGYPNAAYIREMYYTIDSVIIASSYWMAGHSVRCLEN